MTAPSYITVVAAVIERSGKYLVCKRPLSKRHGGLWEFPGGKLLDGEGLADAAVRELREELHLRVTSTGSLLLRTADRGSPFVIHFVSVEVEGSPEAVEHDEVGWCDPTELMGLPLAPADRRFVMEVLVSA